MSNNPLTDWKLDGSSGKKKNECPPDMPSGDSDAAKAARQKYWIERGNRLLDETGKHHLEWCAKDGHYWIQERQSQAAGAAR